MHSILEFMSGGDSCVAQPECVGKFDLYHEQNIFTGFAYFKENRKYGEK